MKTNQPISEEQCDNTFRITLPDQQGGIFSHDVKAIVIKHNKPHLTDIISPIASDDMTIEKSA
ncbi:MAG: hypothetical protein JKY87_05175 [Mariprofundus sp.]|nr:hypothetical protein [Mariprofundus sp.]